MCRCIHTVGWLACELLGRPLFSAFHLRIDLLGLQVCATCHGSRDMNLAPQAFTVSTFTHWTILPVPCNPSTCEMDARGPRTQSQPWLHSESESSLAKWDPVFKKNIWKWDHLFRFRISLRLSSSSVWGLVLEGWDSLLKRRPAFRPVLWDVAWLLWLHRVHRHHHHHLWPLPAGDATIQPHDFLAWERETWLGIYLPNQYQIRQ